MPVSEIRCSVVGLGKLGAPLAAVLAAKEFITIGVDLNPATVKQINELQAPVHEPQLQTYLNLSAGRLRATTDIADAILNTDITFIIVPTPSDQDNIFTNKYVLSAVEQIGKALKNKSAYHVLNITSTVIPGSTDGEIRDCLERASGKKIGAELGLCYNPEFIALGTVVRDLLNPDMILLGQSDEKAGDLLSTVYRQLCDNNPPIHRLSLVDAEITKISLNTYLTTKISFANTLAEFCETIPGTDVNAVTRAIGLDSRVSPKYMSAGTGFGGPCFPRDALCFAALASKQGTSAHLAIATTDVNNRQIDLLVEKVKDTTQIGANVAILGLAYKPNSNVTDASTGVSLCNALHIEGFKVKAYDPLVRNDFSSIGLAECVRNAETIVVTTASSQFLELVNIDNLNKLKTVIDCWRLFNKDSFPAGVELKHLGVGPSKVEARSDEEEDSRPRKRARISF